MRRVALLLPILSMMFSATSYAALSRPVVMLDGDPAVVNANSEDILLTQVVPGTKTTEFGSAVAFGDVNGDGYADAVVGQRTRNKVYIYLGSAVVLNAPFAADPNAADIVISAPTGAPDRIQQFGFSVAVGRIDGDPYDDLVIGAPFSNPGGRTDQGLAWVLLSGGALSTGQSFAITAPPAGVTAIKLTRGAAGKAGDLLGFAVGTGALTSLADRYVVVTARDADVTVPTRRADAGAVHVAFGSTVAAAGASFDLSTFSAVTFFGTDAADAFGETVTTCDVDGSGDADLLVGAIFGDGPGNTGINRGETLVFLGDNIASGHHIGAVSAASAELAIHGRANGDDFGWSVACGDLNDDGLDDLVVGAIFADPRPDPNAPARPTGGEVHLFRGMNSQIDPNDPFRMELLDPDTLQPIDVIDLFTEQADLTLAGATPGDQFGFAVSVGDLDGDGMGDLMASARRYDLDRDTVNTGAVYQLLGSTSLLDPGAPGRLIDLHAGTARDIDPSFDPGDPIDHLPDGVDGVIIGAARQDHAGWALATGDLDGDGVAELMISAIGDLARVPGFRGQAYIIFSADADGDAFSDASDRDDDNDGVSDTDETAGTHTSGTPTDPRDADTDGDGIGDGTELGFTCLGGGGSVEVACDDTGSPFTGTDPSLPSFFLEDQDPSSQTDPLDDDSDDDGLSDGAEDQSADGEVDTGETDPSDTDTDDDLILDGTEVGLTTGVPGTNTGVFIPDADSGASVTNPRSTDSDGDLVPDGVEDADRNGAVAGDTNTDHAVDLTELWTETDAADNDTDRDGLADGIEDRNRNGTLDSGETNPLDQDSDDDGLPDGRIDTANGAPPGGAFLTREGEDLDLDGVYGTADGESSPLLADSDGDTLGDGLEAGVMMGGGVAGRNMTPDTGPGGDGTDTTSPNLLFDADMAASTTNPASSDSDGDLVPDGIEDADRNGAVAGDTNINHAVDLTELWTETDAADNDTDRDGLTDGIEDRNRNGTLDSGETNPLDQDSDDDGLPDGWIDGANGAAMGGARLALEGEDLDLDGDYGTADGESSPLDDESDGDLLGDGLEAGVMMGGGVGGRNMTPDTGPGGDGTDPTSPNFRIDGDAGFTTTEPWDADTDDDGLPDGYHDGYNPNSGGAAGGVMDGIPSEYEGEDLDLDGVVDPGETHPVSSNTDIDGVQDGVERGVLSPGFPGPDMMPDPPSGGVQDGTSGSALQFDTNDTTVTLALDADMDDDGLSDGTEDADGDGTVDLLESDPADPDTDNDLLKDGLEAGLVTGTAPPPGLGGTDIGAGNFVPDQDPLTMTSFVRADDDGGGATDGDEDADRNGRVDPGERNPKFRGDDDRTGVLEFTDSLNGATSTTPIVPGGTIFLRIDDDFDQNTDPNMAELLTVLCMSSSPVDAENVVMTATSPNSAIFTGSMPTSADPNAIGALTVASGATVTCTYADPDDPVDQRVAMLAVSLTPPNITDTLSASCGHPGPSVSDTFMPVRGGGVYDLVAGQLGGTEGSIGTDSRGRSRPTSGVCAQ